MEENIAPTPEVSSASIWQKVDPRTNMKGVLILLGVIIVLGGLLTWNTTRNSSQKRSEEQRQTSKAKFLADNSIVYGYWTDKNSVIEAVDLSTNTNNTLAVLPNNIKEVSVLSNDKIMFIKDTDANDHGKSVVIYSLSGGDEKVVAASDSGFGIDEYVVSKNGQYIATWEVSSAPDTQVLSGGHSRIYSVSVSNPGQKNLIYDEAAPVGQPIHYPVGITNNGDVYMDKFLPNSGAGWAYGMSVSNFTGTQKTEIPSMQNGTYSSQPTMSPDGTKILFIGYDGSKGDGTQNVNGFRRAIVTPNTIETLDTNSKAREKLVSGIDGIYQKADWDLGDGNIIYIVFDNKKGSEAYKYYFDTHSSKKIDMPADTNAVVKSSLASAKLLLAQNVTSDSALGNLGFRYAPSISNLSVFDPTASKNEPVSLNGGYVQFIGLLGSKYFKSSNITSPTKNNNSSSQGTQIQLESFVIKPTLAPKRLEQQSDPPQQESGSHNCVMWADEQCKGVSASQQNSCYRSAFDNGLKSGACHLSPLYLYGKEGTKLNVSVGTPIFSPNTSYSAEKGFSVTLLSNGSFLANGSVVDSLSFDYTSGVKKITRPSYGKIVKLQELEQTIKEYAQKFGFNQKETEDTLKLTQKIRSPYIYVSFYDDVLSKQILPLYFSPQPDTYRNIVLYFEQFESKPNLIPLTPIFDPIVRSGFTAVEISYILK